MNDLDDHLSRIQTVQDILSHSPLLHRFHELLHDLKAYICFEKRHLDFLQGSLDIGLRQSSLASQILEYVLKSIR